MSGPVMEDERPPAGPVEINAEQHARELERQAEVPGADRDRLLHLTRLARKGGVRWVPDAVDRPGEG